MEDEYHFMTGTQPLLMHNARPQPSLESYTEKRELNARHKGEKKGTQNVYVENPN